MDQYAMYIRKSRYDHDYAEHNLDDTLKRHQTVLEAYARREGLLIAAVYKEVASGESISQRPEMQRLLEDVGEGIYAGVLVMDIDRLSRGNSIDQGIVGQTFKYSNTKIITPTKTYDPNDDYDEEYFEFSLYMSRKEYKIINKRLERGRKQSAKEGRFMGSIAPYGYDRVKIKGDKGYTLKINPDEAKYVRMMYDWYLNDGHGIAYIANRLNELGVPTRTGVKWSQTVVKTILHNCVYAGLIRMSRRKKIKMMVGGKVVVRQTYSHDYPIYNGLHDGIVSREEWEQVKVICQKNNRANIPLNYHAPLQNYFAGRIFCQKCGGIITRTCKSGPYPRMSCLNTSCDCVSVTFDALAEAVRAAVIDWFGKYKRDLTKRTNAQSNHTDYASVLSSIDDKIKSIDKQLQKCYEMLEQDVYTVAEFRMRKAALDDQLRDIRLQKDNIDKIIREEDVKQQHLLSLIPTAERLISGWDTLSAEDKNDLIKTLLRRIEYYRPTSDSGDFVVDIYPNL